MALEICTFSRFVPYELIPGTPVNVQVQVDNILSAALSM